MEIPLTIRQEYTRTVKNGNASPSSAVFPADVNYVCRRATLPFGHIEFSLKPPASFQTLFLYSQPEPPAELRHQTASRSQWYEEDTCNRMGGQPHASERLRHQTLRRAAGRPSQFENQRRPENAGRRRKKTQRHRREGHRRGFPGDRRPGPCRRSFEKG